MSTNLERWQKLASEVGEWSQRNFGGQESKAVPGLVLGPIAPLMGMVEELGELFDKEGGIQEVSDAIGDIGVYLMDYCHRSNFRLDILWIMELTSSWDQPQDQVVHYLGLLFHAELKRHQGIRGYDKPEKYNADRERAIIMLLKGLDALIKKYADSWNRQDVPYGVLEITEHTWKSVKERDWKKNSACGVTPESLWPKDLMSPEFLEKHRRGETQEFPEELEDH